MYKDDIVDVIDPKDQRRHETPVIETVDDNGMPVVYNYFEVDPKMLATNENGMITIRYKGYKNLEMIVNNGLIYLIDPRSMALDFNPDSIVPYNRRMDDPAHTSSWDRLHDLDR